jgi:hypothetical protein
VSLTVVPEPRAVGYDPTDPALAMVQFLLVRLDEEEHLLMSVPEPMALARRIGATRALAESWVRYVMAEPQVEVETWSRGFADGILLGLLAAAQPYRDHPNWDKEWDE